MLATSLIILCAIFCLNIIISMYSRFGYRHYWFFELLHFISGFFISMLLFNFSQSPLIILMGLGIITFIWESIELFMAKIPPVARYVKKKLRLRNITPERKDTILDIILNFLGAALFLYLN